MTDKKSNKDIVTVVRIKCASTTKFLTGNLSMIISKFIQ